MDEQLWIGSEFINRLTKLMDFTPIREGQFWEKLEAGEIVYVVELDPPATSDVSKFMDCARDLKRKGIDIMTLADSPSANPKVDSCILAAKVKRELGIATLPHITCRDRNGVAMRALFMGLQAEGVNDVLLVTGDPIGEAQKGEYKSVFEYNSRDMAQKIQTLVGSELATPFNIFGALNVNATNFDAELERAKGKIENGMCGLLTQPVFTETAIENLKRASKELECYLFGGIMPITSEKNARFLDEQIAGIKVSPEIIEMYVGKTKDESSAISIELATATAEKIRPFVDGFYLMTPFYRTDLISAVLDRI